jgi:hypothetical protein
LSFHELDDLEGVLEEQRRWFGIVRPVAAAGEHNMRVDDGERGQCWAKHGRGEGKTERAG